MTAETSNARGEWVLVPRSDLLEEDSYGVYGSEFYRCKLCGNESGAGLLNKGIEHSEDCPLAAPQPPAEAQAQGGGEVEQRARELALKVERAMTELESEEAVAAIAAALSQQPEARGVVDGWKPAGVEPPHNPKKDSLGTEYLIHPPTSGGDRTAFYGRRLGGAACWYRYGAPVHGVEYWHELPADPAALTEARNVR